VEEQVPGVQVVVEGLQGRRELLLDLAAPPQQVGRRGRDRRRDAPGGRERLERVPGVGRPSRGRLAAQEAVKRGHHAAQMRELGLRRRGETAVDPLAHQERIAVADRKRLPDRALRGHARRRRTVGELLRRPLPLQLGGRHDLAEAPGARGLRGDAVVAARLRPGARGELHARGVGGRGDAPGPIAAGFLPG